MNVLDRRTPTEVAAELHGLLAFPLTPFAPDGTVNTEALRGQVEQLIGQGVAALFPGCGTGEFPSLSLDEQASVVRATVEQAAGRVPVLTGTAMRGSIDAGRSETLAAAGADGFLVFPPSDRDSSSNTQSDYYRVAGAGLGRAVIPYQKDGFRLADEMLATLNRSPEIIGIKDGDGDLDLIRHQRRLVPSTTLFVNGTPTAEVLEVSPDSQGLFDSYSSALLNCMPEVALEFARARVANDRATMTALVETFIEPFVEIRDRRVGYAVALVKAAARLRGIPVGPVRAPLQEPTETDLQDVAVLLERATRQLGAPVPLGTAAPTADVRTAGR